MREAITRFRDERNGNAAILLGLSLVPLVFLGGMALDFSSAIQKRNLLNAAADAAALAAVTPAMLQQPVANAQAAAENMFNGETSTIPGLIINSLNVNVGTSGLTRTVTVSYTASSVNSFAGVLGQTYWPISSGSSESSPQASSSAAANINFYLLLDNSPSMDLPATSAGITAMINATKNAPSNGGNAGGCAFACHESDPAADNLGNPGGIDNYQLAQNLGVVTRIQNMASATQSLMTTAASTEASNNATYKVAIYTFNDTTSPNIIFAPGGQPSSNLTSAQAAAANINVMEVYSNNYLTKTNNNNDTDTDFENAMSYINGVMPNPGTGGASSTPQEVLFIVSDGVDDEVSSTCSQQLDGTRCQQPFNTTWCNTVKNRGILIAVLYTEYLPLPASGTGSNSWYNSYVAPYQSQIGPNLQNCASSGLFFSVTTDGDITAAMQALFQQAVTTARLTQ
ncbi:MAG: pilus assembly protein TadG-related protein [Xanthobacteraceae bacterium]